MADWLAAHAAQQSDKVAVIDDRLGRPPVTLTFADLNQWANQLAGLLADLGVNPDVKVAWCGKNSVDLLALICAIRKIGAVGVPLNHHLAPSEAAYVLNHSDARVLYIAAEYEGLLDCMRADVAAISDVLVFDGDGALESRLVAYADVPPPACEQSRTADIFYTSGTTGRPKGALRDGSDPAQNAALARLMGLQGDDVYLTTGPIYHSGPARFLAMAQAQGNTVVLQHKFSPEDWLRLVETYRVTTTFTAPTPVRMICSLPPETKVRYDRSSMRRLIANAAPWTLTLKERYLEDFPTDSLWEVYGAAETGVATVLEPQDQLRKPGSCGRPAPGVDLKLFDANGAEIAEPYVNGELYVRSGNMFTTYYKAVEDYDANRRGDYHTVGDIAHWDDEGYYYIADRKEDMIITGGMNVYPAEVEAVLDESPDVHEAAVFGIPSDAWGESVHAVVVAARSGVSESDVITFAKARLAGYKMPRSLTFIDELPKTGSGKVLKRELRAGLGPDARNG